MLTKIGQFLWDKILTLLTIAGIGIVAYCWLFEYSLPEGKEYEAIIAGLVLYFGILYNIMTYKISADKFSKELFNEFNERFDKMNENLNRIIKEEFFYFAHSNFTIDDVVIDYMNLCAEEYYWYRKGRVDYLVWDSWKKGMIYYLKNPSFMSVVEDQRKEKDSYYGLYDELGL